MSTHTILLVQAGGKNTRTYLDANSVHEAMDLVLGLFERLETFALSTPPFPHPYLLPP